jgi:hypothetical protein
VGARWCDLGHRRWPIASRLENAPGTPAMAPGGIVAWTTLLKGGAADSPGPRFFGMASKPNLEVGASVPPAPGRSFRGDKGPGPGQRPRAAL